MIRITIKKMMSATVDHNVRSLSSSASMNLDTVIIGAGVIGLAVARAISRANNVCKEIYIIDRGQQIGMETSSRNSEVIHGGFYYPNNTYKAKFCVDGKQLLYQYCIEHNIYTNQCGKLIIANNMEQRHNVLDKLHKQAQLNGVHDTKLLSKEDVKYIEPSVNAYCGALLSPSTGIVDSHDFMSHLLEDVINHPNPSTTLLLRTNIQDARIISTNGTNSIQLYIDGMWFTCKNVINCAGLWANHIAELMHPTITTTTPATKQKDDEKYLDDNKQIVNTKWKVPSIYFAKGTYYTIQGSVQPTFQHLIYPIPEIGGLGIHATFDKTNKMKFGPDVEWLDPNVINNPDMIDMKPNSNRIQSFYDAIRQYWPELHNDTLIPDYIGIRPKLSHPLLHKGTEMPFEDFLIVGPKEHGKLITFNILFFYRFIFV